MVDVESNEMSLGKVYQHSRALVFSTLLSVGCLTFLCAATVPYFGGADERLHLDYAWHIGHGRFPQFHEGAKIPLYKKPPPVQFVAHHPPLYYALQAPLTRYFIDVEGDVDAAAMAARMVNVGIGLVCVLALIWIGGVIDGSSMLYRIGIPAVFCSFLPFIKISSLIFNDALALLFAVLGIGLSWRILYEGPSRHLTLCLATVSALGMASRATHIGIVLIGCSAVWLNYLCVQRLGVKRSLQRSIVPIAVVLSAVVLTIGWFYWRNYTLSGSWTRVAPQSWAVVLKREYKDVFRVLSELRMWIFPVVWPYGYLPFSLQWYVVGPLITGLMTLYAVAIFRCRRLLHVEQWLCGVLLGVVVLLSYAQQIVHATGYGAFNPRYLMLVYVVIAICIVRALRELPPWLSTSIVAFCAICGLVANAAWSISKIPVGHGAPEAALQRMIWQVTSVKGVSLTLFVWCALGALVGMSIQLVLWHQEACRVTRLKSCMPPAI